MNILVTRHGETDWNLLKKIQGRIDNDLNEKGKNQARETKEKLNDEKIDLIICSPLKRTRQTAEIINEGRNIEIIYDEDIIERDFGEFEGCDVSELDKVDFWNPLNDFSSKNAENVDDLFKRVNSFLEKIKKKYPDKRILIVTHGGVSIPIYCYFNEIDCNKKLYHFSLKNCEVASYEL